MLHTKYCLPCQLVPQRLDPFGKHKLRSDSCNNKKYYNFIYLFANNQSLYLIITLSASKLGHLAHDYFVRLSDERKMDVTSFHKLNDKTQVTLTSFIVRETCLFFCEQWNQLDLVFIESSQNAVRLTHLPCMSGERGGQPMGRASTLKKMLTLKRTHTTMHFGPRVHGILLHLHLRPQTETTANCC